MFRWYKLLIFIGLILILAGCEGFKNSAASLFESSERAKYERRFSGSDSLLTDWKNAYAEAENTKLQIADGFSFSAGKDSSEIFALSYTMELNKGDLLKVDFDKTQVDSQIFIDLTDSSTSEPKKSKLVESGSFSAVVNRTGTHTVIIQPKIEYRGRFSFSIYTQPSYGFPVSGKGNRDVQSFWGADRDAGARRHEGVDIFAKRGTPVIAAVAGRISRTGNTGLGGKQVWLRDGLLGNSLYYAHLDSIMTESGATVQTGDTLGTVGSTGNAEGGAPHLHFGIYTVGGAVDPYPFIRKRAVPQLKNLTFEKNKTVKAGSNLRSGPGTNFEILMTFSDATPVKILAGNGEWFHIQAENGIQGFISSGRLE